MFELLMAAGCLVKTPAILLDKLNSDRDISMVRLRQVYVVRWQNLSNCQ
jgi:hypothetical protein